MRYDLLILSASIILGILVYVAFGIVGLGIFATIVLLIATVALLWLQYVLTKLFKKLDDGK